MIRDKIRPLYKKHYLNSWENNHKYQARTEKPINNTGNSPKNHILKNWMELHMICKMNNTSQTKP